MIHSFLTSPQDEGKDTEVTEEQLIAAAQADLHAFEPLYDRYAARIYRYIRTRTNSDEEASDLTQQVFLSALHALPRYRLQGKPFAAWLFRIARYAVNSQRRKQRVAISWDLLPEEMQHSEEEEPEMHFIQQERLARLRQQLISLDTAKRELLALRFAAGLSSSEIAAVVGKSPAAVKKQLTRIQQTLKGALS